MVFDGIAPTTWLLHVILNSLVLSLSAIKEACPCIHDDGNKTVSGFVELQGCGIYLLEEPVTVISGRAFGVLRMRFNLGPHGLAALPPHNCMDGGKIALQLSFLFHALFKFLIPDCPVHFVGMQPAGSSVASLMLALAFHLQIEAHDLAGTCTASWCMPQGSRVS